MTDGISDMTFETLGTKTTEGVWLIEFGAAWCAPCHALEPVLKGLAESGADVQVGRVDVSAEPQAADQFQVKSVPTMVILRNGQEIHRLYGAKTRRQLDRVLGTAGVVMPDL
jgi:thioredoxin 1